jgi:hypothetical protein
MTYITNFSKVAMVLSLSCISFVASAQSILGTWQLAKQTTCIEDEMMTEDDSMQSVMDDMKGMSSASPQVVKFKEKGAGTESTRILNKRKPANKNNFLYKFDGEVLLILDKKSQTITETFTVDKISQDSLIISNASRECDTKIFLKIKEAR